MRSPRPPSTLSSPPASNGPRHVRRPDSARCGIHRKLTTYSSAETPSGPMKAAHCASGVLPAGRHRLPSDHASPIITHDCNHSPNVATAASIRAETTTDRPARRRSAMGNKASCRPNITPPHTRANQARDGSASSKKPVVNQPIASPITTASTTSRIKLRRLASLQSTSNGVKQHHHVGQPHGGNATANISTAATANPFRLTPSTMTKTNVRTPALSKLPSPPTSCHHQPFSTKPVGNANARSTPDQVHDPSPSIPRRPKVRFR